MSLHVEVRGRGRDLVLLHGWALHGETWGPWLEQLEPHARLHIVDLPGHGLSPWPDGAAELSGLATTVAGHVPKHALLLGWSLGGMVALEVARLRGAGVPGLILVATTPRFVADPTWPHGMATALLADFAGRLRDDYDRTVQNFLALQTRGDVRALETLRALRRALARKPAPAVEALDAGLEILRKADLRSVTASIAAPALVISGEHDRLTPPAAGQWLAATMPNARHRTIRGAAHAPFLSHASDVLDELRAFLAGSLAPAQLEVRA